MNHVAGGVERMLSTLMNELVARGHDVSLLTWDQDVTAPFYTLAPEIRWHKLSIGDAAVKAGFKTRWQRAMKVRKIVKAEKPDVILTFQNGAFLSLWVYTLGMNVPVIVSERNAPTMFDHTKAGKYKFLWLQVYGLAPHVIIQTQSQKLMYPKWVQKKIDVISNPVFPVPDTPAKQTYSLHKILLSVGRLDYQKNQIVLIMAFHQIMDRVPDWTLRLVGNGKDRANLEAYVAEHGMQDRVEFTGDIADVLSIYRSADLFCLPSRWEGFPNALAEALSCGLPSVGFAECAGVNDLIEPGTNGLLAAGMDNPDSLAEPLLTLMNDPSRREQMSSAAKTITQTYTPKAIFDQWEDVLRRAAR